MGIVLLFGVSACSEIIKIRPIPTPGPPLVEISQPSSIDVSLTTNGKPVRIVAEAVDLDAPVVEMGWRLEEWGGQVVSEWNVPEFESGWHQNSALPGQGDNVVISGHNNSSGGHVFGNLEALIVGDQITLWTDENESFVYQVSEKQIVRAFAASQESLNYLQAIMESTSSEQLTLITCWPSWTNTHRLIIVAHPL